MEINCSHTDLMDIDLIQPNPRNPNKHPETQIKLLAKIMNHQGWRSPVVVSNRSGFVIKGHGRLQAAKLNGWTKAPVDKQDCANEADEYADMVADNKIAELAESDMGMIYEDALKLPDLDFDLLGIPDFIIPETLDPQCDEDEVPEKVEPRSKLGDLYKLGNHRLLCGDATIIDSVQKLMSGHQADLVVTDPPYNVAVNDPEQNHGRNRRKNFLTIANDKMSDEDFEQFLISIFTNYFSALKEGSSIYVFYSDSMTIPFLTTFSKAGFHFAQNCIWNKQKFVMTRKDYHYKHEPVMYGWKQGQAHNWYTDRKQVSVWNFDRPFKNELHPTMKPIDLIEYPILNSSKKDDIVLDLFGGFGSTMIACEKTNRKCFSMELDPHYCDVIVARWEKYTGKIAELING